MSRITAGAIARRKNAEQPFPMLTAYDAASGRILEAAGLDVILVGDSLGNVVLGYESTTSVTLEDMIRHGGAVVRGTKSVHVIVDMPFGTYEASDQRAIESAVAIIRSAGCQSVKLEGGATMAPRIAAIVAAGIPVMAHIGVLPQTAALASGFKMRRDVETLIEEALAVERAGAFAVVLEAIDHEAARAITARIAIPTIGIGAGPHCDGQVLVLYDAIGMFPNPPSFAKRFGDVDREIERAARNYIEHVRAKRFPA